MRKTLLVARREFLFNLRRKSFLFAAFGLPLVLVAVLVLIFALMEGGEGSLEDVGQVGYVDHAGVLANAEGKPDSFVAYDSEEAARQALDDGTLGAYFVVPENYMPIGVVQLYNYATSPEALKDAIDNFLRANLVAGVDETIPLERLEDPVNLTVHIQDSGRVLEERGLAGLFITPFIFFYIFILASQITSSYLMNGVVEEKVNRIMEILLTSITPTQMLVGKLLGLAALGLMQLAVWGIAAVVALRFSDQVPILQSVVVPPDLLVVGVIFFFLGYFLMAGILGGLGAISNTEEESRQYAGIFSVILVIPIFAFTTFIDDPNGALPVVFSLIPITAPLAMILRMGFGAVPLGHIVLSMGVMLASTVLIVWASARVFRWGLLMYGKRPTPRQLWRVIRQSPQTQTVAAHSQEA